MKYFIVVIILVVGLTGCNTVSVTTAQDPYADLSSYKTFDWMEEKAAQKPSSRRALMEKHLRFVLERELSTKGLQLENSEPDILISYYAHRDEQVMVYSDNWGGRDRYGSYLTSNYLVRYDEGTLIIDFVDSKSQEVVWQASIQAFIDESDLSGQLEQALQKAMREYPSRKKMSRAYDEESQCSNLLA